MFKKTSLNKLFVTYENGTKDKKAWQKTSDSFFLRNLGISSFLP